jgi:hypothetical protein
MSRPSRPIEGHIRDLSDCKSSSYVFLSLDMAEARETV